MPDSQSHPCPFCRPDIARSTWLATPEYRVVYNISPLVPGHSLVIPRRHVSGLLTLTDPELSQLFQLARQATDILLQEFKGEGFDWTLQDGEAAGQTVPHVHLHIVPRKSGDLLDGDWHQQVLDSASRPPLSAQKLQAMVEQLRQAAQDSDNTQI